MTDIERQPEMRRDIGLFLKWLRETSGVVIDAPIEHGVVPNLRIHQSWLTIPPYTGWPRLVIEHPEGCGCDALPDHVLLEG